MQKNVLEYLENRKSSADIAFEDENETITFKGLYESSRKIGSYLSKHTEAAKPIVVLSAKGVKTPAMFFGVLYAGCYYVPLSTELPVLRLKYIIDFVKPKIILTDGSCEDLIKSLDFDGVVIDYSTAVSCEIDKRQLDSRVNNQIDTDPMYVIFTSGSSGKPKGVITSHRSVIDYIDVFAETFNITGGDIIASQAPLDYVAAIRDIYLPLKTGAKTVLIPKNYFSMPARLMELVNKHRCTILPWVASALSLCAELKVFDSITPESVRMVFFTGSVLPSRHLRYWQQAMPNAVFINHYGPTEITASCSYHVLDHVVEENEVIPIGKPFKNTKMFLLKESDDAPKGEICVAGTCLALGYFGDAEVTEKNFINNPLNNLYYERIYKTGDIGSIGDDGNFYFHGRKDFQIKHMGHRIELAEIENACMTMENIKSCACVYDYENQFIWLFYVGEATAHDISVSLRKLLPSYMIPRKFVSLDRLPLNAGGKTDYEGLKTLIKQ